MGHRDISEEQAREVLKILVEECDYRVLDPRDGAGFVRAIMWPQPQDKWAHQYPCNEYRFMGALGFGGKFRNNGNRDNTPHVDCYREDETPARRAMVERANERLAELFGANT